LPECQTALNAYINARYALSRSGNNREVGNLWLRRSPRRQRKNLFPVRFNASGTVKARQFFKDSDSLPGFEFPGGAAGDCRTPFYWQSGARAGAERTT
jgi:hypothetical protein